jgi:hypothetical protein
MWLQLQSLHSSVAQPIIPSIEHAYKKLNSIVADERNATQRFFIGAIRLVTAKILKAYNASDISG